jgi:formate-dependent nitrite reductase membrane component NrfD
MDRLDAVTFDITTRYQRNTNVLTFWLTVLFGALESGFLASDVASSFYMNNPFMVILWTFFASAVTAAILSLILYNRIK